jgi:predicted nucleic acid-binding protein
VRLAADASAIIEEALRTRGRDLFEHPDLDLYITVPTWSEVEHEIPNRLRTMVQHGRLAASALAPTLRRTLLLLGDNLKVVTESEYEPHEAEARDRIPRDPRDWPTVALALALGCGVWTVDQDFFGCGVPVWTTGMLLTHVETGRASLTP